MWWNPWAGSVSFDVALATHASAAELARLQARRLAALLKAARDGSALYRSEIGSVDPATMALGDLPVIGKCELMHRFDDWVTDPRLRLDELRRFVKDPTRIGELYLGQYMVWESSGSSGEPAIFVQCGQATAVYDALEARRRRVLQPLRRCFDPLYAMERMAFVGATDGHFATTVTVRRLRRLNPFMAAGTSSFSFLQPVQDLVAQLNEFRPTVLATYPTAALMLAEEAVAKRLRVQLGEVWTGGEALTPAMRDFIAQAFGCPVAQSYGSSEFFAMATECRFGALHLNSDWLILESVDEHWRPVPDGQEGCISLLTNLANHVQPLIRYDLGDRVTLRDGGCACGSALPVIEVQGRVDDSLLLRAQDGLVVRLLPLALTTVLEEEAKVFDFQIIQQGEQALLLRVASQGEEGVRQLLCASRALRRHLEQRGLSSVSIDARSGEASQPGRSGKLQRVIARHASPPAANEPVA